MDALPEPVPQEIIDQAVRVWAANSYSELALKAQTEILVRRLFPRIRHLSDEDRRYRLILAQMIRERSETIDLPSSQPIEGATQEAIDEAVERMQASSGVTDRATTREIFQQSFRPSDASDTDTYSPVTPIVREFRAEESGRERARAIFRESRVITPRRQNTWSFLRSTPRQNSSTVATTPIENPIQMQSQSADTPSREIVVDLMDKITDIFGADIDAIEQSQMPIIEPIQDDLKETQEVTEIVIDDSSDEETLVLDDNPGPEDEVVVGDTELLQVITEEPLDEDSAIEARLLEARQMALASRPPEETRPIDDVSRIVASPVAERVFLLSDDSDTDDGILEHQVEQEVDGVYQLTTIRDLSQTEVIQTDINNTQVIPTPPPLVVRPDNSYTTLIERFSTLAVSIGSTENIAWIHNAIQSGLRTPGRRLYFARQIITFLQSQNESLPQMDLVTFDQTYSWIPAVDFNDDSMFYPMGLYEPTDFENAQYNTLLFDQNNADFINENALADKVLIPNFERLLSYLELQQITAFKGRFDADLVDQLYTLSEDNAVLKDKRHALSTLMRAAGVVPSSVARTMRVRYRDNTTYNSQIYTYIRTKQREALNAIKRTIIGRYGTEPGFLINALALWIMLPEWADRPAAVWAGVIMQVINYTDGFAAFVFDSPVLQQIESGVNVLTETYVGIVQSIEVVSERVGVDTFRRTIIDPLNREQQTALVMDYLVWTVPAAVDYIIQQGLTPTRQQLVILYTNRTSELSTEPFHLVIAEAPFPEEVGPILVAAEEQGLVDVTRTTPGADSPDDIFSFVIVTQSGQSVSPVVIPDAAANEDVTLSPLILN